LLILTRRIGEGLTIGEDIRIVVLEVRGKQVCLGIESPREIAIHRDEIFQRLSQENQLASSFELQDLLGFKQYVLRKFAKPK
jgi:carbon storage regulator